MSRIVVVTTDSGAVKGILAAFTKKDVTVRPSLPDAQALDSAQLCEFLFVDVLALSDEPQTDYRLYRKAMYPLWRAFPNAHVVVLSSQARTREAVKAVKAGANDYLTYPVLPLEIEVLRDSVLTVRQEREELDYLRDQFWHDEAANLVRTHSPAMHATFDQVRKVAPTRSTVLLTGETGTGKNVVASLLHRHSQRAELPYISLHCGAIPDTLLESELFGHERGAFTGAVQRKLGKFEIAHGGTLLLDEIGTITPAMQIKLLQVLQDGTIQRVGSERPIQVDVRILAATNLDLAAAVKAGDFRADLFYRLSVFPVEIPPLRQRREDIALLAAHFLAQLEGLYAKEIDEISPQVLEAFDRYDWPGNVRELESLMERAYILESSSILTPENFPVALFSGDDPVSPVTVSADESLAQARKRAVDDIERVYLKQQLERCAGRVGETARAAGITPRQLHSLMKKHGLRKERFRPRSPSRRDD